MPHTARTTGPLHFEDLDPKRFEDLIRQLAYEFRVWRRLEATGRSGSDDGFDARGWEIVADGTAPDAEVDDGEPNKGSSPPLADRVWLIQCKRERTIGPTKLAGYLDQIALQGGETLHGIIFAAACDFSKDSHDVFAEKCRALGVQEFQLWGKATIEDLLFQPKNDHLLFAYFGFSLVIRQRTLQATLRRDIATKRRLKTVIGRGSGLPDLIIRNASGDMYPQPCPRDAPSATHWHICQFEELSHAGLVVEFAQFLAFMDGDTWDAADIFGLRRSWLYLSQGRIPDEESAESRAAFKLWQGFADGERAWLHVIGIIPYDRILAIDDAGDEFFELPQVYCQYVGKFPSTGLFADVRAIESGRRIDVVIDDPKRIKKFPDEFRRPSKGKPGG